MGGGGKVANTVHDSGDSGGDFRQWCDGGRVRRRGGLEGERDFCGVVTDDVKQSEEIGADEGCGCFWGRLCTLYKGGHGGVAGGEDDGNGGVGSVGHGS